MILDLEGFTKLLSLGPVCILSKDKCCFEIENLVTSYKLLKDYFSKGFCIIILYLQPCEILKWRKVYGGHISTKFKPTTSQTKS